jgi:di- and tripeptidase/Cys-Gly metallodipeptidase DUG1
VHCPSTLEPAAAGFAAEPCAPAPPDLRLLPQGQASDACHLANERLRRVNLIKGKNVVRHLMEDLAASACAAASDAAAAGGGHLDAFDMSCRRMLGRSTSL